MSESASAWMPGLSGLATATVRAVSGAGVELSSTSFGVASARLAVPAPYRPRTGDSVLVASAEGARYVIGVLRALREPPERTLVAEDGSRAALDEDEDGVVWRLFDAEGRLTFEHRAGKSVVHVAEDLELSAAGDLSLRAGGRLSLEGAEGANVRTNGPIEIASAASSVRLDGDRACIRASVLDAETDRASVKTKEANLVIGTLRTVVHRVIERAEVVERTAGRVVERAREVYREIEGLSQTKAGRVRVIAETALTLVGGQTLVTAREDVKIKGEKIYLG